MKCWMIRVVALLPVIALLGCSGAPKRDVAGLPEIDGNAVLEHTKVLASDEYEGRAPGSRGEELTVNYIIDQFKKVGLKPGNTDGAYIQNVPLVGITADPGFSMSFHKGGSRLKLQFKDDFVAWTKRVVEAVEVTNSELVFVGYGVQAPEYNWDDFKGADLKGKTLIMLVGDPPVPDPADPAGFDPDSFGGRAMTYYGRWTYKYEIGAKLGAEAVLIVHETGPAGYPFSVVQSKVTEQFDTVAADKNMSRVAVEGWITLDRARELFKLAGKDYDALKKKAVTREFRPVPLAMTAAMKFSNKLRTIESRNVVGKLEGSDPKLKDEYVIYVSHWDHFGIGPEINGDKIYNGALDNATGIGGMVELGRAFAQLPTAPRRSILFLAVTAEEQGLLGSDYYARNPIYPLAGTLGVINMDGLTVFGQTRDIEVIGLGKSDLDDYAQRVAAEQGRVIKPDQEPGKGLYYRSDHFPFARQGVPALNSGGGEDFIGKPADFGKKMREDYTANHYHKPSDEVRPDWDLSGAAQDLQYYWMVGYRVAQADKYPEWKPGSEFKAIRDASGVGPKKR